MLPARVLSIAIRPILATPEKRKKSGIDQISTSAYSSPRQNKKFIQPCHDHFRAMKKKPKSVLFLLLLRQTFFLLSRDFSGTTADTDIVIAPLEPLRPDQ